VHFLVHIPGCIPSGLEAAAKVAGLNPVLGGNDVLPAVVGPSGEAGLMISHTSPTSPYQHYDAEKQQWTPSVVKDEHGKSRYWVGIWTADPPKEKELRRPYTQKGPITKFGSQSWILPTPDTVDARAVYADDGTMRWETIRQYAWLCDEAKQMRQVYLDEFGMRDLVFRVDPGPQIEWLIKLLQINYRILPEVAIALDMWVGQDHIIDTVLSTLGLSRKGESTNG
jgi:hypothetical protein